MHFKALALAAIASTATAQSLTAALLNQSSLSNLTTYLGFFPDLVATLSGLSNITLLAPNNDAFTALLSANNSINLNDTSLITALFSYHVLEGTYANFSTTPSFIPTVLMPPTYTNVTGGQVVEAIGSADSNAVSFFSGFHLNASTTGKAIPFTGGSIHIIDAFLTLPGNISTTGVAANLTSAVGALSAAKLADTLDTLSDVTVFVPDNAAFQAIGSALANISITDLTSVLEYHVIKGTVGYSSILGNMSLATLQGSNLTIEVVNGSVFVNAARVIVPDVLVANGVVHVIDAVLNPGNTTATPNPSATGASPAFSGASSASNVPFTSGVPTPTAASTAATTGATVTSTAAAGPARTAAVGMGALFGGAAVIMNL